MIVYAHGPKLKNEQVWHSMPVFFISEVKKKIAQKEKNKQGDICFN